MAARKDDSIDQAAIIPLNERHPELEEKVAYWMSVTPDFPKNTKKITRTKDPELRDPREVDIWYREEIRRIKEGHFGMNGKSYFWYNYVQMEKVGSGLVRPDFRLCQHEWFKQIEECQNSHEFGLVCVKRRRIGASWMEAADVLHDCMTIPHFRVGMTSKTETDAVDLFKKVKFIYDHLPLWLRPTSSAGNTRTTLDFAWKEKDAKGNWIRKGTQSNIQVKAPTDTGWEGAALWKLIVDEGGKIGNLRQILSYADDTMMVGTKRVGTPIVFGTAGDIGKEGKELMEVWYSAAARSYKQFFFGGWMGLDGLVDQYGNDMKEDAIRWIVYTRKRLEGLSSKEYTDFIQKYPLTVAEAFKSSDDTGLGNQIKIEKQRQSLLENPVKKKVGYFKQNGKEVIFVPDKRAACIIYEEPESMLRDAYCAGCDPTDHETSAKDVSSLSMFIMKKQSGTTPPKIVFEYTDRPPIPRDYYEQAILALLYYNKTKVLIERNKFGMITYFDERGFKYLLQTAPQGLNRLVAGNTFNIGFYATKATNRHMEDLISEYIEDHADLIPSVELLEELQKYGIYNTDRVSAIGATLMFLREDKTVSKEVKEMQKHIPDWSLKRVGKGLRWTR